MKTMTETIRNYHDLMKLDSFEERFEYLKLSGTIGSDTFGFDRYLNQNFYKSEEWKEIRRKIIVRDSARDLAVPGRELESEVQIHHMNPISKEDILSASEFLTNPEYLICVSAKTHKAIHYGDKDSIIKDLVERKPYDTCPWHKNDRNEVKNDEREHTQHNQRDDRTERG